MLSEMPSSASRICWFFIWRLSTSSPRISARPAFTSVASWRVNWVSTLVLIRPWRNLGSLILISMFLLRPPPFFAAGFFAALPRAGAAAGAGAALFTSPSAVGISPCALTAAIAELRSPASTVPRVSLPDASLAMYWKVAISIPFSLPQTVNAYDTKTAPQMSNAHGGRQRLGVVARDSTPRRGRAISQRWPSNGNSRWSRPAGAGCGRARRPRCTLSRSRR